MIKPLEARVRAYQVVAVSLLIGPSVLLYGAFVLWLSSFIKSPVDKINSLLYFPLLPGSILVKAGKMSLDWFKCLGCLKFGDINGIRFDFVSKNCSYFC